MGQTFKDGMNISDDHKFKLSDQPPERWCILRTPENAEIVNKWINAKAKETFVDDVLYLHYPAYLTNGLGDHYLCGYIKEDYTLITDDQFKRWFVKEENSNKISDSVLMRTTLIHSAAIHIAKGIAFANKPFGIDPNYSMRPSFEPHYTPTEINMEKEFTNEEKRQIYNTYKLLKSKDKSVVNMEFCYPFYITYDKVDLWEGDMIWFQRNGIIDCDILPSKKIKSSESILIFSTSEALEQWIADNRSISVKDVFELLNSIQKLSPYHEFNFGSTMRNDKDGKYISIKEFELKLKEISK